MGLNSTPSANRVHIGFFGRRNAGKSSVVNAVTGQELAVVSDTKGTTTDPVEKTLEFAPLGPVVFLDTAGLDDEGELGTQRTERTLAVLPRTDMALVVTAENVWGHYEETIVNRLREQAIPFLVVMNKTESSVASKDRRPFALFQLYIRLFKYRNALPVPEIGKSQSTSLYHHFIPVCNLF